METPDSILSFEYKRTKENWKAGTETALQVDMSCKFKHRNSLANSNITTAALQVEM